MKPDNFLYLLQNSLNNISFSDDEVSTNYQFFKSQDPVAKNAAGTVPIYNVSQLSQVVETQHGRRVRYKEYDDMIDDNSDIAAAVDAYADNISQIDYTTQHTVQIQTDNEHLKEEIELLLYKRMNIDKTAWTISRLLCKDGDWFAEVVLSQDMREVEDIQISEHPENYYRVEQDGNLVCWLIADDKEEEDGQRIETFFNTGLYNSVNNFASDFAHSKNMDRYRILAPFQVIHCKLETKDRRFQPYGKSILENCRKSWKQWRMMENSMMINCINNAPERFVFGIPVGDMNSDKAMEYINGVRMKHRKKPIINFAGELDERAATIGVDEHIYIPMRNDGNSPTVTKLDGAKNLNGVTDVTQYFRKKVLTALKMPPIFLSQESNVDMRKVPLANLDIMFAKTIQRIQLALVYALIKPVIINMFLKGYDEEQISDVSLTMTPPNALLFTEQQEAIRNVYALAGEIKNTNLLSDFKLLTEIVGFTDEDANLEIKRKRWEENGLTEEEGRLSDELNSESFSDVVKKLSQQLKPGDNSDTGGGPQFNSRMDNINGGGDMGGDMGSDVNNMPEINDTNMGGIPDSDMNEEPMEGKKYDLAKSLYEIQKILSKKPSKTLPKKLSIKDKIKDSVMKSGSCIFEKVIYSIFTENELLGLENLIRANTAKDTNRINEDINAINDKLSQLNSTTLNEETKNTVTQLQKDKILLLDVQRETQSYTSIQQELMERMDYSSSVIESKNKIEIDSKK